MCTHTRGFGATGSGLSLFSDIAGTDSRASAGAREVMGRLEGRIVSSAGDGDLGAGGL